MNKSKIQERKNKNNLLYSINTIYIYTYTTYIFINTSYIYKNKVCIYRFIKYKIYFYSLSQEFILQKSMNTYYGLRSFTPHDTVTSEILLYFCTD